VAQENKVRHDTSVPRVIATGRGGFRGAEALDSIGFCKDAIRPIYFLDKQGLNSVDWLQ
jgi:hypothetical protein